MADVSYVFVVFAALRYAFHISASARGEAENQAKVFLAPVDNCRQGPLD
jgi:hypothetical protein